MLKIIYAIPHFDATGSMRAPYQILKGFARAGWKTEILTIATPENLDIDMVWNLVPLCRIPARTRRQGYVRLAANLLKRPQNTIVLSYVWDWHSFALTFDQIIRRKPFVITLDGYAHRHPWHGAGWLTQAKLELRYGVNIRNANLILAENPSAYQQIRDIYPDQEVRAVPKCLWEVDLVSIEESWVQKGYPAVRKPKILYTGRIERRKGIHDLVKAFGEIATQFPQWKVEVRGPKTDATYFDELTDLVAQYHLESRVCFEPMLSGEDLYRQYRASSIYCLPSTGEGFPTTITEAMYFGGAIISGSSGSTPYQLDNGRAGLLFPYGDVTQLKHHLEELMGSEERRNGLMKTARQRVIDVFFWERYFPTLERDFLAIVANSCSRI